MLHKGGEFVHANVVAKHHGHTSILCPNDSDFFDSVHEPGCSDALGNLVDHLCQS